MYSVILISIYIIYYCKHNNYSITNLKLQKLLYFVQAQFLVEKGKPAFNDDIEAWDLGPVVPRAYHYFKIWGNSEIPWEVYRNTNLKDISVIDMDILNRILDKCARYSASYLVNVVHNQGPWKVAYKKNSNNVITNDLIKDYFNV